MAERRISRAQFLGYLNKLAQGEPVTDPRLRRAAVQFGLDVDRLLDGAERHHVKRDQVRYTGIDIGVLDTWRAAIEAKHEAPRIDQASLGNSHNARVSGAILTVRSRRQPYPRVIMVDQDGMVASDQAPATATHAVIVENLENFLELEATLALLPCCGLGPEWQEADILYGSGNSVTNHLFTPVFQRYREIGCLFDPDPGGVRMCDTLCQRVNPPVIHFLAPDDLEQRLIASPQPLDARQRADLSRHMRRSPPVSHVAGLIRKTGRQLEQETYLFTLPATEAAT